MPKTILDEREDALMAYINEKKGKVRQYKNYGEFAEEAMVVSLRAFSRWKSRGFPAFFHSLCQMCQKTNITDRQLCRIFGVEYKGRTKDDCIDVTAL